jgi:lysozyme family protein
VSTFEAALPTTLEHEGGYQDDPKDHANWQFGRIGEGRLIGTKYGVTGQDFPNFTAEQMKELTPQEAGAFYKQKYWKSEYDSIESQDVATKLFDMGILFGAKEAVKELQRALTIEPDGEFGELTLQVVNGLPATDVLYVFKIEMVRLAGEIGAKNPAERGDVAGWIKRINS